MGGRRVSPERVRVLLDLLGAVTGPVEGRGGGPAGRAPCRARAWSQVSGLGRARSSSRVSGSKNIRVSVSILIETRRPARISPAGT